MAILASRFLTVGWEESGSQLVLLVLVVEMAEEPALWPAITWVQV